MMTQQNEDEYARRNGEKTALLSSLPVDRRNKPIAAEKVSSSKSTCANNNDDDEQQKQTSTSLFLLQEAHQLVSLTFPTLLVQFGFTIPQFIIASFIGRSYGYLQLDGFTLATLTGNVFILAVIQGLYSASDTLMPQAFGAGNDREVGLLAIRGVVGSMLVALPLLLFLLPFMKPMLVLLFRQDPDVADLAFQWFRIFVLALPFYTIFEMVWKFLSCQEIMAPLITSVIVSLTLVLPLALGWLDHWFGFLGSSMAMVVYFFFLAFFALLQTWIFQPYKPSTWSAGFAWTEAMRWDRFSLYIYLGMGGMLANSEWIFWELFSLIVGSLGKVPLGAHSIATQVITVAQDIMLALGTSLAIRIGNTLSHHPRRAKNLAVWAGFGSMVVFGAMTILMYTHRRIIFGWFTKDEEVILVCEDIWWLVCFWFFNLSIFCVFLGIATGLGMQWTLGIVSFVCLGVFGLPSTYYFAIVRDGGIRAAWACISPPYIVINAILLFAISRRDWESIAEEIRAREGVIIDPRTTSTSTSVI